MKKVLFSAAAVLALASCSNDSLVSDSPANNEAPIAFNVGQKNITRSDQLEDNGYNDFGVWAYKYNSDGSDSALVMGNYQVGCAGHGGFSKDGVNTGKWFYEGLGNSNNQVLHYWDLSYANTKFFAYAPYNTAVEFDETSKKITIPASVNKAGTSHDYIYAGNVMSNATHADVPLKFKHLGAKVILKFYEDIPGYTVKLINVKDATDEGKGIQLTPATYDATATTDKYKKAYYYTAYDAVIDFSDMSAITVDAKDLTATTTDKTLDNLIFDLPTATGNLPTTSSSAVAAGNIYYAVAQPSNSNTGFTLHVSYELEAEDNHEKITVRDARVFIPAKDSQDKNIAVWEASTQYTYTFKITTDTNGSTSSTDPTITDPNVPTDKGLYPIVFEDVTIVDYSENNSAY